MFKWKRLQALLVLTALLVGCGSAAPAAIITPVTDAPTTAPTLPTAVAATAELVPTPLPPTDVPLAATTAAPAAPTEPPAATAATAATAVGGEVGEGELKAALQETVDQWSKAYNEGSVEELKLAVDQTNPPVRRVQASLLEFYTAGGSGDDWSATVETVTQRPNGFVQAGVDVRGRRRTFVFKQINGQWLISEPKRAELGKRVKVESEHFSFQYYPWDADIIDRMVSLMEQAHTDMVGKMGKEPDQKSLVQLIPTIEVTPSGTDGLFLAYYRRGSGARLGSKEMVINSPNAFTFGSYDSAAGWEGDLLETLAHEYVHLVNDCCFTQIARQAGWMTEGLAVYLSEGGHTNDYMPRVIRAVQNDELIPIRTTDRPPGQIPRDLEGTGQLPDGPDNSLAYGEAATLVDYIVTNYGGIDGYWKLIGEYDTTQSFEQALQNVLGISYDDFDKGWREDLQKRYGS